MRASNSAAEAGSPTSSYLPTDEQIFNLTEALIHRPVQFRNIETSHLEPAFKELIYILVRNSGRGILSKALSPFITEASTKPIKKLEESDNATADDGAAKAKQTSSTVSNEPHIINPDHVCSLLQQLVQKVVEEAILANTPSNTKGTALRQRIYGGLIKALKHQIQLEYEILYAQKFNQLYGQINFTYNGAIDQSQSFAQENIITAYNTAINFYITNYRLPETTTTPKRNTSNPKQQAFHLFRAEATEITASTIDQLKFNPTSISALKRMFPTRPEAAQANFLQSKTAEILHKTEVHYKQLLSNAETLLDLLQKYVQVKNHTGSNTLDKINTLTAAIKKSKTPDVTITNQTEREYALLASRFELENIYKICIDFIKGKGVNIDLLDEQLLAYTWEQIQKFSTMIKKEWLKQHILKLPVPQMGTFTTLNYSNLGKQSSLCERANEDHVTQDRFIQDFKEQEQRSRQRHEAAVAVAQRDQQNLRWQQLHQPMDSPSDTQSATTSKKKEPAKKPKTDLFKQMGGAQHIARNARQQVSRQLKKVTNGVGGFFKNAFSRRGPR